MAADAVRPSKTEPTAKNVREHDPISDQAVDGMLEGRGAVLFENEMADPCESIAQYWNAQKPPQGMKDRCDQRKQHQCAADEVHSATASVPVLFEIVGIKVAETIELLGH